MFPWTFFSAAMVVAFFAFPVCAGDAASEVAELRCGVATATAHVRNLRDLRDADLLKDVSAYLARRALAECWNGMPGNYHVSVLRRGQQEEDIFGEDGAVVITINGRGEVDIQSRIEKAIALEDAESRDQDHRASALAACGSEPQIAGGPWFSSTYTIAAKRQALAFAQGGLFLCVTRLQYLGPAPNPFGGNAAHARVDGFDLNGNPKSSEGDFPY